MSREVVKELFIAAPADVVWKALTDAAELTRWFPVEARVTPGVGGSIWISWGEGASGEAPITAWEPSRHFQWTESRGAVKVAIDFHLESRDGGTVVRLVQSGFGDGAEFDDEFHMADTGWAYFIAHLRLYLERHRGVPRDLIGFRTRVPMSKADAYARLRSLLVTLDAVPFVESHATCQAGFTIASLNDAILFIEIEPGPRAVRAGFWLSTYGLPERTLSSVRAHITAAYNTTLGTTGHRNDV